MLGREEPKQTQCSSSTQKLLIDGFFGEMFFFSGKELYLERNLNTEFLSIQQWGPRVKDYSENQ